LIKINSAFKRGNGAAVKQFKCARSHDNKDGKEEYPPFLAPTKKLEP
jgi:hypothetical protein